MADAHVITLVDGRELGYQEFGHPEGRPVLGFHGTPGSRRQVCVDEAQPLAADVRLIAPDRPGYGLSTFQPGRRLAGWAADVEQLADRLELGAFCVMGISGGGPHALSCAAVLADRVSATGVVSGVGPLGDDRIARDLKGSDRVVATLAQKAPALLSAIMSGEVGIARRFPRRALELFVRQLPASDAAVLDRPAMQRLFELELTRASATTGRAMAQDLELFATDWGFDLAAIRGPVVLWQGTDDRNVPIAQARFLHDELEGSVLHVIEGEGHLLVIDRLEAILRELASHEAAAPSH